MNSNEIGLNQPRDVPFELTNLYHKGSGHSGEDLKSPHVIKALDATVSADTPVGLVTLVNTLNKAFPAVDSGADLSITNHIATYIAQCDLGSLDGQALAELFSELVKIVKESGCSAALRALDSIAMHLFLQSDLENFEAKHLAKLIHGFRQRSRALYGIFFDSLDRYLYIDGYGDISRSYLEHHRPCQLATLLVCHIAAYFSQRNLANFSPQQLASLVGGFTLPFKNHNCLSVISALDHFVLHLLQRDLTNFKPNQLTRLIRGLQRLIKKALHHPPAPPNPLILPSLGSVWLRRLVTLSMASYISQCNLAIFESEQLADLVCAFSRELEESGCLHGFKPLDPLVVHLLQRNLTGFGRQTLANLLNGLRRAVGTVHCLFLTDEDRFLYLRENEDASLKYLVNLESNQLVGLISANIAAYILHRDLANIESQLLTRLVIKFSKLIENPDLDRFLILATMDHIALHLLQRNLANCQPLQIAKLINGLRKMAEWISSYCQPAFGALDLCIARHENFSQNLLKLLEPQQITNIIIGHIIIYVSQRSLVNFRPQQLSSLILASARMAEGPLSKCEYVLGTLNRIFTHLLQCDWSSCEPQQLAHTINELSKVFEIPDANYKYASRILICIARHIRKRKLANFTLKQLARITKGLCKMLKKNGSGDLYASLKHITKHIQKRNLKNFNNQLENFNNQAISVLVKELSEFVGKAALKTLLATLDHIAELILTCNLANFKLKQLAKLVNGFSRALERSNYRPTSCLSKWLNRPNCPKIRAVTSYLTNYIMQTKFPKDILSKFDFQQIKESLTAAISYTSYCDTPCQAKNNFAALGQKLAVFEAQVLPRNEDRGGPITPVSIKASHKSKSWPQGINNKANLDGLALMEGLHKSSSPFRASV